MEKEDRSECFSANSILMYMDQATLILFWISFVGICIFTVNSVYAMITIKLSKSKPTLQSEKVFNLLTTTLAILFIALAISNMLSLHSHNPNDANYIEPPINPNESIYEPFGKIIVYDTAENLHDTTTLYIKSN